MKGKEAQILFYLSDIFVLFRRDMCMLVQCDAALMESNITALKLRFVYSSAPFSAICLNIFDCVCANIVSFKLLIDSFTNRRFSAFFVSSN